MDTLEDFVASTLHGYYSYLLFFAVLTPLELIVVRQRQPFRCRFHGLMIWLAYIPASVLIYGALYALWGHLGIDPLVSLPLIESLGWAGPFAVAVAAIASAFVADFLMYWYHRAQHYFLWPIHAVHHSVRDLNAINSYHHVSEAFFAGLLVALPTTLVVVDYGPTVPLLVFLTSLHAIYLHSPTRLNAGPLRAVFGDNVWHRIHHSFDPAHYNRNFGVLTTFWDRIFRTAYFPKSDEWPDVGITDVMQPRDLRDWVILPLHYRRTAT